MAFLDSALNVIINVSTYLWHLFGVWLAIFLAPFSSFDVAWIIIPIWLSWFFADYFQEKASTSFGNVVSNGIIPLWISLDWTRFLIEQVIAKKLYFSAMLVLKFSFCIMVLGYGILIVIYGLKAKKIAHYLGRIREVTYLLLMLTPVIYGVLELTWYLTLAMVVYFPLWYFGLELLFKYMPDPKAFRRDEAGS